MAFLLIFFGLYGPLCAWFGFNNPAIFDLRANRYPETWAEVLAVCTTLALFIVPLTWIAIGRAIDVLALTFMLSGLIIVGYFFLDLTAPVIFGAEKMILTAGEQTVAVNSVGFFTLLLTLAAVYAYYSLRRVQLPPMRDSAAGLDRQLRWFLLPGLAVVVGMIALPMVLTRTIPMLSGDPMVGRGILEQSTLGRPLYNLGSSLLPALVASNLVLALRNPGLLAKVFCPEAMLCGVALVVQFLTSNRLPIANTILVFFALLSLERKIPRAVLVFGVVAFIGLFLGMSGFSSILRQSREMLDDGNIVAASYREAFLGNNLSDLRDGAWVFGYWDFKPLDGKTYLGALAAFLPSAVFPQKKDWYLGLVALQIVGWPTETHFGLRISFFAESFLNFGLAGVIGLGVLFGCIAAYLLKKLHLSAAAPVPCLTRNLRILLCMQLTIALSESSQGFVFYSIVVLLGIMWVIVDRPVRLQSRVESARQSSFLPAA